MAAKPRVVVLGGGFAGCESLFLLRHRLGDAVDLTLVSQHDYFIFRPNTIYVPFGEEPAKYRIPLDGAIHSKRIEFIQARAKTIDLDAKRVDIGGNQVAYDYLIVATGAGMRPGEIPGLREHATMLWTPNDTVRLQKQYRELAERAKAGERQRLLFLVPPNNRCVGPVYELALMTDTWLTRQGVRAQVDIEFTTCEDAFIQAFGPRLNTIVAGEFEQRGIAGHTGFVVTHIEPGVTHYQNGERRAFDVLVSFAPYVAGQRFGSLPLDDRGFIHVDPDSRRVKGRDEVFAAGDVADFPIKLAFLALLQADVAAEHVAARIRGEECAARFEPMCLCLVEELNKATFAQVPLEYTGDAAAPVAVAQDDADHYKVGVSPLWRMGKGVLGMYVPWRFSRGEPFQAGFLWDGMDLSLKVMARVLSQ